MKSIKTELVPALCLFIAFILTNTLPTVAQKNDCNNRVKLFMMPIAFDESVEEGDKPEITRQVENYITSMQQYLNYKLVKRENADVVLGMQFFHHDQGTKDEMYRIIYTLTSVLPKKPVYIASQYQSIIAVSHTDEERATMTLAQIQDELDLKKSGVLKWLQKDYFFPSLFTEDLFNDIKTKEYKSKDTPRKVVVIKPFRSKDQNLLAHAPCLEYWLLEKVKESAVNTPSLGVRVAFEKEAQKLPEGIPTIYIETELVPKTPDAFEIVCKSSEGELIDKRTFHRVPLEQGHYRPFINKLMYQLAWRIVGF